VGDNGKAVEDLRGSSFGAAGEEHNFSNVSQASLARPCDKGSVKVDTLEWLEAVA
jgi:hypothetical protein